MLQTSLNDFHISYELNASVLDVLLYRETLSELLASLQDRFAEAGVEILSPTYEVNREGSQSTVPPLPPPTKPLSPQQPPPAGGTLPPGASGLPY